MYGKNIPKFNTVPFFCGQRKSHEYDTFDESHKIFIEFPSVICAREGIIQEYLPGEKSVH